MSKNKDAAVEKAVLDYLKAQNRPYSSTDIFNNLHNEHGKTAIVRALEQLAQENKIKEKTYGKQKVYFPDQDELPDVSESELAAMDQQICTLNETLQQITQELRSKESLLASLSNSLTTEQIIQETKLTTEQRDKLKAKLEALSTNTSVVPPEVKEQIYKDNAKYVKEWRVRKRMANEMIDAIMEGYQKGKKALLEEAGVETDEDVNVSIPK